MSKALSTSTPNRPLRERLRDARGQGMTEYIIIVALIAIAAIGVVTIFGDNIRALFAGSADALAGDKNAKIDAKKASGVTHRALKDFTNTQGGGR